MPKPLGPEERQGFIRPFVSGLSFPKLFLLLSGLFLLDLAVPDMIPFLDEMFLAALTVLIGMWRDRRATRRNSAP
jgi:hypothetical protein